MKKYTNIIKKIMLTIIVISTIGSSYFCGYADDPIVYREEGDGLGPFPAGSNVHVKYSGISDNSTKFIVYDAVNNGIDIPLDHTAPVASLKFSGDNYVLEIEDQNETYSDTDGYYVNETVPASGIWKVEDDNGVYIVSYFDESDNHWKVNDGSGNFSTPDPDCAPTIATITRSMKSGTEYNVTFVDIYDHANNKRHIVVKDIENKPPTIGVPTYLEGYYTVTVSDPDEGTGNQPGEGSGIWKIVDTDGTDDTIQSGVPITRQKMNEPEVIYVYDKAQNMSSMTLTVGKPYIYRLEKRSDETQIKMTAMESDVDLWKVTETASLTATPIVTLTGSECTKTFNITNNDTVRKIYVWNHAGNYTEVNLIEYEENNFERHQLYVGECDGSSGIKVFDAVNNGIDIPLDHTAPDVVSLKFSGDNYVLEIEDQNETYSDTYGNYVNATVPASGIWKVEDDNGVYIVSYFDESDNHWKVNDGSGNFSTPDPDCVPTIATITRPMKSGTEYNVTFVDMYDHANNKRHIVVKDIENTPPTIGVPTYSEGNYIVTVYDPDEGTGNQPGEGSGIWKIVDTNGTDDTIQSGVPITRPKINGPEVIYVYDKAQNMSSMSLTTSKPYIFSLEKRSDETKIKMTATESNINLWKVTETASPTAEPIATLTGRNCTRTFNITDNNTVRTIYVWNHAGNYIEVNLLEYEESNFGRHQLYVGEGKGYSGIKVFDAVNNVTEVYPLDNTPPTITDPVYKEGYYIVVVADDEAGVWKVVDNNGTYYTSGGELKKLKNSNQSQTVTVFDHANNRTSVDLYEGRPQLHMIKKKPNIAATELLVTDAGVDLWKITKTNGDHILWLNGRECQVQFDMPDDITTIRLWNHAGNYTDVEFQQFETNLFPSNVQEEIEIEASVSNPIRIYDGVGNFIQGYWDVENEVFVTTDNIRPTYTSPVYKHTEGSKTMFKVAAADTAPDPENSEEIVNGCLARIIYKDANEQEVLIKNISGATCATNFEVDSTVTSFIICDSCNNRTVVDSADIQEDNEAPDISKTYINGQMNILATDNKSGIWKITDDTGNIILKDYSKATPNPLPAQVTYEVPAGNKSVRVYDAVGNYDIADLRRDIDEGDSVEISGDELNGIRVKGNATITFTNQKAIIIGGTDNDCPGIEIDPGKTLTINNQSSYAVNIVGGTKTDANNNIYRYAGIYVPANSTLNIGAMIPDPNDNTKQIVNTDGVINAYGRGLGNGTGAGIGGNGIIVGTADASTASATAGTINITSGKVNAYGGYNTSDTHGLGAGIGGGGIYNTLSSSITAGSLTYVGIGADAIVAANGGYVSGSNSIYGGGAGIGGGGISNTLATTVNGGNITNGNIGGEVRATGGYSGSGNIYGTGAGIGGGGVANTQSGVTIVGGAIKNMTITATADIVANGGYGHDIYGGGAGIGGGGIYSSESATVTRGELEKLIVADLNKVVAAKSEATSVTYGDAADMGDGGVRNGSTSLPAGDEYSDSEAPAVVKAWRNKTNTGFKVNATDNKSLNKITYHDDLQDEDILITDVSGTDTTVSFVVDTAISEFKVWDTFNNSAIARVFTLDETKPLIEATRDPSNNNQYIITATDTGSGLWKIEQINTSDNPISGKTTEYSPLYTTDETTVTITLDSNAVKLRIYDGVGNYEEILLDSTAPTVTKAYKNGIKAIITASDSDSGLWMISENSDKTVTSDIVATFTSNSETKIFDLSSSGVDTVYVFDNAGNCNPQPLTPYTTLPTAVVTSYTEGQYTINVTAANTGLDKITDANGVTLTDGDYSSTYPTDTQTYVGQGPIGTIKVYDAIGNIYDLVLDTVAPTIPTVRAYKKDGGIAAIIEATDTGGTAQASGLWKVVESESSLAEAIGTFDSNGIAICTLTSASRTQVYLVDKAGNISGAVTLEPISDGPTGTLTYTEGTITLSASSSVGIASIGETSYPNYPTNVPSYTVTTESITLTDAVGNESTVQRDTAEPTGVDGYYKGQEGVATPANTPAVLTVADTGGTVMASGLWKIAQTDGTQIEELEEACRKIFSLPENVTLVKVYDHAGNSSSAISLQPDNEVDTAEVSINLQERKWVVSATDSKAGLDCIKDANDNTLASFTKFASSGTASFVAGTPPLGVAYVYDVLGNRREITLDDVGPVISNVYNRGDNLIRLTLDDASGVDTVKLYEGEELIDTLTITGSPENTTIEIASTTTKIIAADIWGNESELTFASVPVVSDIYKKPDGKLCMTTSNVTDICYYTGDTKTVLKSSPQPIDEVTIPSGVTNIYITDSSNKNVLIDIGNIIVTRAMLGQDEVQLKMYTDISSDKVISNVDCLDSSGDSVGSISLRQDQTILKGVREVPDGTVSIKLVYADDKTCKIILNEDSQDPQTSSIYKTSDGKTCVTLEDPAGIEKIAYYDSQGELHEIEIDGNPTKVIYELDVPTNRVLVYDVFGDVEVVDLIPSTIVNVAAVDNGSAIINIGEDSEYYKTITSITYKDENGETQTISGSPLPSKTYSGTFEVSDPNIIITYEDVSSDTIVLKQNDESVTKNPYIKDDEVIVTVYDPAGVSSITYYKGEDGPYSVNIQVAGNTQMEVKLPEGVTKIVVVDAFGDESEITISGLMEVGNMYKTTDGNILIDASGVQSAYYYDESGNKKFVSDVTNISVPDYVTELYIVDSQGNEVVVAIPNNLATVSKATISQDGTKAIIDVQKDVANIECYDENGDPVATTAKYKIKSDIPVAKVLVTYEGGESEEIEVVNGMATIPTNETTPPKKIASIVYYDSQNNVITDAEIDDIIIEANSGENPIASIKVNYTDGTQNILDTNVQESSTAGNGYSSSGGYTTITVSNDAGLSKVTYELGESPNETSHEILLYGETTAQVTLPNEAHTIKVVDSLGGETEITLPANVPSFTDIQRDVDGNTMIKTNVPLYYEDEDGIIHRVDPENGEVIIPSGINEVYTQGEPTLGGIKISQLDNSFKVNKAAINETTGKLVLNITGNKTIQRIECYNVSDEKIGTDITVNATSVDNVYDEPGTTTYILIICEDGSTKVDLKPDTPNSTASNIVALPNGNKLITFEDSVGISAITYEDANGVVHNITIPQGNPTKVTVEIDGDIDEVDVYDGFGNKTSIVIGSPQSTIENAAVSQDGNKAAINISGDKIISRLTYTDGSGVTHTVGVGAEEFDGVLDINGATDILVVYEDGTTTTISLSPLDNDDLDNAGPEITNKRVEFEALSFTASDKSGLLKVVDDSGRILYTFNNEKEKDVRVAIEDGVSQIYVYDVLDNSTQITIEGLPKIDNIFVDKNGNLQVDTDGIERIYYKDEYENEIELTAPIKMPDGVSEIYMEGPSGEEIKIDIAQVVEKRVVLEETVSGNTQTRVRLDIITEKAATKIVCYSNTGRNIGQITDTSAFNINGVFMVPNGTVKVMVIYDDGSNNLLELNKYTGSIMSDVYIMDDNGTRSARITNEAGIQNISYTGTGTSTISGGDKGEIIIELPSDAQDIVVLDAFGKSSEAMNLPQNSPNVKDIQKDKYGNAVVNSDEILYYEDEDGVEHKLEADENGNVTVSEEVKEVYTKKKIAEEVAVPENSIIVSDDWKLYYKDESGEEHELEPDENGVIALPPEGGYYGETPRIYRKTENEEEVDIDISGVKRIMMLELPVYYDNNGIGDEQELEPNEDGIVIPENLSYVYTKEKDIVVDLSEIDVQVINATVSKEDGKLALNVSVDQESDKQLAQIIYVDDQDNKTTEDLSGKTINGLKNVSSNVSYIKLVYTDGKSTRVELSTYEGDPTPNNTVRLEDGRSMVTLRGTAGITNVRYGGEDHLSPENPTEIILDNLPREITQLEVTDLFGKSSTVYLTDDYIETRILSAAKDKDGGKAFLRFTSKNDISKVEYKGRGISYEENGENEGVFEKLVDIHEATEIVITYSNGEKSIVPLIVDETGPKVDNVSIDSNTKKCITTVQDNRGIAKIKCGNLEKELSKYPSEVTIKISQIPYVASSFGILSNNEITTNADETEVNVPPESYSGSLVLYDTLENETELSLEDLLYSLEYVYVAGDKLAIKVQDIRGIEKIGVICGGQEKTIEKFKQGTVDIRKGYVVGRQITGVKLYLGGNDVQTPEVETYNLIPTVVGNEVYSEIGIKRLVYQDGTKIEFRKDLPTRVSIDLENQTSVTIYDALEHSTTATYTP